jgi:chaperone modulatory protein CbpM
MSARDFEMPSFDDIVSLYRVDRVELTSWIEQRWVRPTLTEHGFFFDEVDTARIGLIRELQHDLMVDEDALDVVLALLDQLYAARRLLKTVEQAIEACPEPVRQEIRERLRHPPQGDGR